MTTNEPEIMNEPEAAPIPADTVEAAPRRRRLRPFHWIALAVGVVLLIAAVVFTMQVSSDRDAATANRVQAQRRLHMQQLATKDAQGALVAARGAAQTATQTIDKLLNTSEILAGLADQFTGSSSSIQSLGADQAATIDDYNTAIDRNNGVIDQYNAMLDVLNSQVAAIKNDVGKQIA